LVMVSLFAFSVANAKTDFHGVLHSNMGIVAIDSVYLIVPPDSLTYATSGWGNAGAGNDTFDFPDSLNAWPQRVHLMGDVSGFPARMRIEAPLGHRWYSDMGMSFVVMFYGAEEPGVEERRLAAAPLPRLDVSPSVMAGQMTVRLQPVGTGRPVVEIHDAVGNVVRSINCTAGTDGVATATWNREDESGRLVPEGVYFCRYAASDLVAVRKVLVAH
jgi:hypothetical protein